MAAVSRKQRKLLPYENVDTTSADTARRWLTIYEQREALLGSRGAEPDGEEAAAVLAGIAFWRGRVLELIGLDLDADRRVLLGADYEVHLTRREFELLQFMGQHLGRSFQDEALAIRAWGTRLSGDQVRIYIRRLREKLAGTEWHVSSRRGYGYMLEHGRMSGERPHGEQSRDQLALTRARAAHAVGRAQALMAAQRAKLDQTTALSAQLRETVGRGLSPAR